MYYPHPLLTPNRPCLYGCQTLSGLTMRVVTDGMKGRAYSRLTMICEAPLPHYSPPSPYLPPPSCDGLFFLTYLFLYHNYHTYLFGGAVRHVHQRLPLTEHVVCAK